MESPASRTMDGGFLLWHARETPIMETDLFSAFTFKAFLKFIPISGCESTPLVYNGNQQKLCWETDEAATCTIYNWRKQKNPATGWELKWRLRCNLADYFNPLCIVTMLVVYVNEESLLVLNFPVQITKRTSHLAYFWQLQGLKLPYSRGLVVRELGL